MAVAFPAHVIRMVALKHCKCGKRRILSRSRPARFSIPTKFAEWHA